MEDYGKFTEAYTIKINSKLKKMKDEFLTPMDIMELNQEFRVILAKRIHHTIARAQFQEEDYLSD